MPPRGVGGNIASSAAVASGSDSWQSVSMDFIFGPPPDHLGRSGAVVFVDRPSKMVHLAAVKASASAEDTAELFLHIVFRHHGLPDTIVSDRDPRSTSVLSILRRMAASKLRSVVQKWSSFLPLVAFALNNVVYHRFPSYTNYARRPRAATTLRSLSGPSTLGGGRASWTANKSTIQHNPPPYRRAATVAATGMYQSATHHQRRGRTR